MNIDFTAAVAAALPEVRDIRREFHRIPEVAHEEFKTSELVAKKLAALGLEVRTGVGGTGVVGVLRGGSPGRTLGFRADIDALPVTEETGLPFASEHSGRMHACGHDGHIAIALGTAKVLSSFRESLRGNVVFFFQPAEETVNGSEGMIKDGALDSPKVEAVYGLHIWPEFALGILGVRSGPVMASVDAFEIELVGKGGHGAMPHRCVDPVVMASEAVLAFQRIVSREIDPLEPAVVTVGKIAGGTAFNVIPERVKLTGTVRTFKPETRTFIRERLEDTVKGIAEASRGTYTFSLDPGTPALLNDEVLALRAQKVLGDAFGASKILTDFRPSMGGDDFSLFAEKVPGLYFYVGTRDEARGYAYPLHHPKYVFDEAVLAIGVRAFTVLAADFLA